MMADVNIFLHLTVIITMMRTVHLQDLEDASFDQGAKGSATEQDIRTPISKIPIFSHVQQSKSHCDLNDLLEKSDRQDNVDSECDMTVQRLSSLKCAKMNITASNSLCHSSCMNKCGQVIPISKKTVYPCQCDQACWLYGDCCMDYYHVCLKVSINTTSARLLTATLDNLQNYSQLLHLHSDFHWSQLSQCWNLKSTAIYFQLVVTCSSHSEFVELFKAVYNNLEDNLSDDTKYVNGLSQEEIKQRCEETGPGLSAQHMLDHTHVTLIRGTPVHFYNVFCAICNGISPNNVKSWTVNITCNNQVHLSYTDPMSLFGDALSNNCTIQNVNPPTCYLRACYQHSHNHFIEKREGVQNHEDTDDDSMSNCIPSSDVITNLCERYLYPFKNLLTKTVYRNVHCYLHFLLTPENIKTNVSEGELVLLQDWIANRNETCERIPEECDVNKRDCPYNPVILALNHIHYDFEFSTLFAISIVEKGNLYPSYRILYDFQSHVATVTVNQTYTTFEKRTCPEDQVYVPLYESCRRVHCLPGYSWAGNQCMPINACTENDTNKNDTCHVTGRQELDYKYPPYPEGSSYIRLNIALDYVFMALVHDTLFQENRNCSHNNEDLNGEIIHSPESNISTDNITHTQNSGPCAVSINSMSLLFTESSLRNVWVKELRHKNIDSTTTQDIYDKKVNNILHFIPIKVKEYLVYNHIQSQIEKLVICSGSECFTYDTQWLKNDNYNQNLHPYDHQLDHTSRLFQIKHGRHSPDIRLSFIIHLNSSDDLDTVSKAAKLMVSDVVTVAYDNNFLLSRLEVTNSVNVTNDGPARDNNIGSYDIFVASNSELCQIGETIIYKSTQIENDQNGTYIINFYGTKVQLDKFVFSLELSANPLTLEGEVKLANIGWCQVNVSLIHCESSQLVLLKPPDFIIYNGTLMLNSTTEKIMGLFYNHSETVNNKMNVTYLNTLFAANYDGELTAAVREGLYLHIRSGVLICSNYTNVYQIQKVIFMDTTKLRFTPYTQAEMIATYVASGVSIVSLLFTLAVYSYTPSLRNIPGKIVMSLAAAILCAQVLFLCCQVPEGLACEIYASVHHAVWLASIAWLTAMSVDLAYILNIQSNAQFDMSKENTFKIVSVFSWGIPCLIASTCLALFKAKIVDIGYGQNGVCWIGNLTALLIVFGAPVFLALAVTFVCAVVVVKAIRNSVKFRNRSTATRRRNSRQLSLCIRLSLLMGFNWLFYFLAVGVDNTWLWAAHILVNGSQGLYIFLCFVARKTLLFKLIMKLRNTFCTKSDNSCGSPKTNVKTAVTTLTPHASPSPSIKSLNTSAFTNRCSPVLSSGCDNTVSQRHRST